MDISPSLYQELEKRARGVLRRRKWSDDPETVSLVHRAYANMHGATPDFESRAQFLTYASKTMRTVLLNLARDRQREKRGGGVKPTPLIEEPADRKDSATVEDLVLDLDQKLDGLTKHDATMATLVELKFYGGCTWAKVAEVTGKPVEALKADWAFARMWLKARLEDDEGE